MFKLLKNLRKREIILIFICFILVCGQVILELEMPEYMSEITMLVETPGSKMVDILQNGISMIFCAFFSLILSILTGFLTSDISAKLSMNIRKNLFKKVNEIDLEDIQKISISSLVTRTTNDITQIQMFVSMGLQLILKAPVLAILLIIKLLLHDWKLGFLATICILLVSSVISAIVIVVSPKFKKMQKDTDNLNNILRENLNGIHVVKSFDAEKYEEKKFEKVNAELTGIQLQNQKSLAIKTPILYLIMYLGVLAIYFIGAQIIRKVFIVERLAIYGDIVVFASYVMQIASIFLMLSNIISLLPRAEVSAMRINEILDKKIRIIDGNMDKVENKTDKVLEFKNVSFKYSDSKKMILDNISFDIKKGETILIVGNTGSGKTSIVNLMLRFYEVNSGEILLDDINIKKYNKKTLYKKIGYIPQRPVIFKDTLKNNVIYGNYNKNISKIEKIENVIDLFDEDRNDNLLTKTISRNEINLSMGQKQKISIARVIMREPELYILDDAFSALDSQMEISIIEKLKKNNKNAAIVFVEEELKSHMLADKVLVLDKGSCVGFGTHLELLNSCEKYRDLLRQGGEEV